MSSKNKLIQTNTPHKIPRRGLITGAAALPLASACGYLSNTENVDQRAYAVREQVFSQYPAAAQASQQASATLLFPEIVKGAIFGLGGAHGDGVMYVNDGIVGRYNMTAATVGIQLGIESFSMMLILMTPESVALFRNTLGFDLGLDVEYSLPQQGANFGTTASTIVADAYALIFNQAGLMVGASLQGAKYTEI